jgi:SH3-like domain-containing protein
MTQLRSACSHLASLLMLLFAVSPAWSQPTNDRQLHHPATTGSETGFPLPRFASLKADVVNLRRGPGQRYPIDWVYHRVHLPVLIIREFDVWRQVRTPDHQQGWVHASLLSGHRSFFVTGHGTVMRASPDVHAHRVAYLKVGVVGRILSCSASSNWCHCNADGYEGYIPRADFWGTLPGEPVHD